ncbi:MAG: 50S ribosomal protein L10 [Dehalococcoidales bacterium]|nr:50S ribosomal protein L10 [Dehalococcoidales bacterium]
MPTEKKVKAVEALQEVFSKAQIGVMTDYSGIKTSELNEMRRKLRDAKIDYKVVKNSLAEIAADKAGLTHIKGMFKDPIAVAFGYGDPAQTMKAISDYIRASKITLKIKAGFMPDGLLTVQELDTLSRLPSREVLLAKVLGGMQAPIYGIVTVLAGPMRGLAQVLQGRINQLEAK